MTAERINCINPNCERMILHQTAERCEGRCAICERDWEQAKFRKEQDTIKRIYFESPPKNKEDIKHILNKHETEGNWFEMFLLGLLPKLINYNDFTEADFQIAVKTIAKRNQTNLEELSEDFLYLCEPLIFNFDSLYKGLKLIPRPYRELNAAYQFWGIMSGDGISSYIEQVSKKFDKETIKGFELMGLHDSALVVKASRKSWNKKEYDFEEGVEDALEDRVYTEAEDFEKQLAKFLIKLTKNI